MRWPNPAERRERRRPDGRATTERRSGGRPSEGGKAHEEAAQDRRWAERNVDANRRKEIDQRGSEEAGN